MKKDQEGSFQNKGEEERAGRRGRVSCFICQAEYIPSRQRSDLLQEGPLVLESALMSMCHFCFRCRRPACPECWDEIHGLCGACVEEAKLPFRTELPPLIGTLLPAARRRNVGEKQKRESLVCIKPGKFSGDRQLPIDMITTHPERPETATFDERSGVVKERKEGSAVKREIGHRKKRGSKRKDAGESRGSGGSRKKSGKAKGGLVGQILFWAVLGVALAVVVVITLALVSPGLNKIIFVIIHIDIRGYIGYLLKLIGQIFS